MAQRLATLQDAHGEHDAQRRQLSADMVRLMTQTDGAIRAIAQEAQKRKVGARGLMMIMEEILLESMYVLPSEKKVKEIVVTKEMIEHKTPVFDVVPRMDEAA